MVEDFSKRYSKEIGLPFYCLVRAELVNSESIGYLKEAGCYSVDMGIETANDYLRNKVLNREVSKEQIISASDIIKRYKIKLRTNNMLGIPFGSLRDDLDTLKLNIRCRPDYAVATIFYLYKNTDLYNYLNINNRISYLSITDKNKRYYQFLQLYRSKSEVKKTKNLHQLFSITVSLPFLLPLVKFLIRLPLYRIYKLVNYILKKYYYRFKVFYYKDD